MPDTTAPHLRHLSIPSTIDVSKGPVNIRISANATDGSGSGVRNIIVYLDKPVGLDFGAAGNFSIPGILGSNTFADRTPESAEADLVFTPVTRPGIYTVQQVLVEDAAGNTARYGTNDLVALGVNTAMSVTGGMNDVIAPVLVELGLPAHIDLSGPQTDVTVTVDARDGAGGSGVATVVVYLDGNLSFTFGAFSNFSVPGIAQPDTFKDGTPDTASNTFTLTNFTAPGTYNVTSVRVSDVAGNIATYSGAQLQALGIRSSMSISGGQSDTVAPSLNKLILPEKVDLSKGATQVVVGAQVDDGVSGSGVDSVVVYLDGSLGFSYGTFSNFSVPGILQSDTFADATPTIASNRFTLEAHTAPGIYNVQQVIVTDRAGNTKAYDSAQLKALGIANSLTVTDGKPLPPPSAAPASVETLFHETTIVHRVTTSGWPESGGANFSLTFEYDASQGSFDDIALRGTSAASLSTQLTEIGGVGRVTVSGYAADNGSAPFAIDVILTPEPGATSFSYIVKSFTVDGKPHAFDASISAELAHGTPGADLFAGADRLDAIDAEAGRDTALFSGNLASYRIDRTGDGTTVQDRQGHVVKLDSVERLQFADKALALDIDGAAGQIYRLYQAAFDRRPDETGIGYWMHRTDGGASLNATAQSFIDSAEFTDLYGAGIGNAVFLDALYQNVLDRNADQGGFAFWSQKLASGVSRADVLVEFSESAENVARVIGSIEDGFSYLPWV